MSVRASFVVIIVGLAMTALLLGGVAYMTLRIGAGSECTAAEEDLIPVLTSQKILVAHPGDAVARDSYAGCFQDDPFPYAGKFYEFAGTQDNAANFGHSC